MQEYAFNILTSQITSDWPQETKRVCGICVLGDLGKATQRVAVLKGFLAGL